MIEIAIGAGALVIGFALPEIVLASYAGGRFLWRSLKTRKAGFMHRIKEIRSAA